MRSPPCYVGAAGQVVHVFCLGEFSRVTSESLDLHSGTVTKDQLLVWKSLRMRRHVAVEKKIVTGDCVGAVWSR